MAEQLTEQPQEALTPLDIIRGFVIACYYFLDVIILYVIIIHQRTFSLILQASSLGRNFKFDATLQLRTT